MWATISGMSGGSGDLVGCASVGLTFLWNCANGHWLVATRNDLDGSGDAGLVFASQAAEQRSLSGAARAQNGSHLSGLDAAAQTVQNVCFALRN